MIKLLIQIAFIALFILGLVSMCHHPVWAEESQEDINALVAQGLVLCCCTDANGNLCCAWVPECVGGYIPGCLCRTW